MKKTKLIFTVIVVCIALFGGVDTFAAGPPGPPGGGGSNPPCWPPPCVPIDGGLSFLMVAGALYGGKKIYDISKKAE